MVRYHIHIYEQYIILLHDVIAVNVQSQIGQAYISDIQPIRYYQFAGIDENRVIR